MSAAAHAIELLADLVGIDSVNPSLVRGAAGEGAIVEHLRDRLERAGFTCTVIDSDGRPSLLAVGPETGGPTVLLNGHLDTVGVSGMDSPFVARIEGDRLFGRGAADMKGGVGAMVIAAEHLVATGSTVRPALALVADEEDASIGSEAVIAALPELGIHPALCLIGEPTDLELTRTLRGFAVVRVRFEGRAAHSSQPDNGVNALTNMGRLLAAVDARRPSVRATGGDIMVTVARGGDSPFVIPDSAECMVERRMMPGESATAALDEVRELLQPEWNAMAQLVAHREAWGQSDTGVAAKFATALGAHLGTGVTFDAPYWMEAPLWESVAPTVVCGPSGGGLHAIDEWVSLEQVGRFTESLIRVLPSVTAE